MELAPGLRLNEPGADIGVVLCRAKRELLDFRGQFFRIGFAGEAQTVCQILCFRVQTGGTVFQNSGSRVGDAVLAKRFVPFFAFHIIGGSVTEVGIESRIGFEGRGESAENRKELPERGFRSRNQFQHPVIARVLRSVGEGQTCFQFRGAERKIGAGKRKFHGRFARSTQRKPDCGKRPRPIIQVGYFRMQNIVPGHPAADAKFRRNAFPGFEVEALLLMGQKFERRRLGVKLGGAGSHFQLEIIDPCGTV